jgi:cbb3-type cytochrome oxidase subunit 3
LLLLKLIILTIVLAIIMILFWIYADRIYRSHYKTKRDHPFLFQITGFNEKYLDDPNLWIKHFRIQLILMAVLFLCVLWMVVSEL